MHYKEGSVDSAPVGEAILWKDASNVLYVPSAAQPFPVAIISGGGAGTQYTEDVASAADPVGNMLIAVRLDSLAAITTTDGDNIALRSTNKGELYVKQTDSVAVTSSTFATAAKQDTLLTELQLKADLTETQPVSLATVPSHAVTNAGTFVVQVDGAALTALQLIDDPVVVLGTTTYTEASSKGFTIAAVRRDADTTMVDTTNEFGPLQMDANGRLKVEAFSGEALPVTLTSTTITGTVAVTQSGTWDEVGINDSGNSITIDNAQLSVVGSGVEATALRVTIATDSTGLISIDDNGGSLTVDNGGTFAVQATLAAGATNIAKAEDSASASADVGVPAMAIQLATPTDLAGTDADYGMLQMAGGRLWVDASGKTLTVASHAVTNAGTFAVQAATTIAAGAISTGATSIAANEDDASANLDTGVKILFVQKATPADTGGLDGDYMMPQMSGGRVWVDASGKTLTVASHAVTNSGTFVVQVDGAALTSLQLIDDAVSGAGFNISQMNGVAVTMGNGVSGTGVQRVTMASDSTGILAGVTTVTTLTTLTGGAVAHDAADSGNPIKVGGRAINAEITAVANNDRVDQVHDLTGKQIVLPYSNPENFVSGNTAALTDTTSTSLIAAPAAGLRNYITHIIVGNSHATVGTFLKIQDGSGGTTLYTIPAASVYGGGSITFPTPLRQPTTATAIFCACTTTGANVIVSASGYKGV